MLAKLSLILLSSLAFGTFATAAELPSCKNYSSGFATPWEFASWRSCQQYLSLMNLSDGRSIGGLITKKQKAVIDPLQGKYWVGWAEKDEHFHYVLASSTDGKGTHKQLGRERVSRYPSGQIETLGKDTFLITDQILGEVFILRENAPELVLKEVPIPSQVSNWSTWTKVSPDKNQIAIMSIDPRMEQRDGYQIVSTFFDGNTFAKLGDSRQTTLAIVKDGSETEDPFQDLYYELDWNVGCELTATLYLRKSRLYSLILRANDDSIEQNDVSCSKEHL